jgi:DNA-directed RNA polymerase subunit L
MQSLAKEEKMASFCQDHRSIDIRKLNIRKKKKRTQSLLKAKKKRLLQTRNGIGRMNLIF